MTDSTLQNLHLVDLAAGTVLRDAWLRIEAGRIAGFGAGSPPTDGTQPVDLDGAFLLPGLWNADVHLSWEAPRPAVESAVERTLRCIEVAVNALRAGITGLRSAGEADYIDCALRDWFAGGRVAGPRIVPAGYFLTTTAGHLAGQPVSLALDGPTAFAKAVRENIRHGAEAIKLGLSGGFWGPAWDDPDGLFPAPDELDAVFATAKQRGLPVMGYATGAWAATEAAKRGAVSIEHGYALDEAAIEAMAANDVIYVPTLSLSQLSAGNAHDEHSRRFLASYEVPPNTRAKAQAKAGAVRWGFDAARKAGVRIACGSCLNPIAETLYLELGYLVHFGMTPREALLAATQVAADLTGCGDETGSIAPGRAADLLAIRRDPLDDVQAVREVTGAWKDGRRVV